jgi:hypothetical protein
VIDPWLQQVIGKGVSENGWGSKRKVKKRRMQWYEVSGWDSGDKGAGGEVVGNIIFVLDV